MNQKNSKLMSFIKYTISGLFLILGSQFALASHWHISATFVNGDGCQTYWSNGMKFRRCYGAGPRYYYPYQSRQVCHEWISRHGYVHQSCYAAPVHCYQWISRHGHIHQNCN